jgi:uncharacterized SAM-binding protein YcdF (DUF218 family)
MPSSGPERLVVVLGYSRGRRGELHPICAARLEHAAALARENDAVLLSGWSRHPTALPEAELMRRAWHGTTDGLICDPDASITAENAANAAVHARELGVEEVVVVTSRWHGLRAGILFRSLLPGVRVTVSAAQTPAPAHVLLRELAVFPLVPLQIARGRRKAAALRGVGAEGG